MKQELMKELLEDLYIKQNLKKIEVCKKLKISQKKFIRLCKKFDIKISKEAIKTKFKQTCKEKYGVDNPMKNLGIRNKAKNTIRENNVVDKRKQTCREKYGVDIVSQNKSVREKIKISVLKAYSTGKPQEKILQTFWNRYNTSNPCKLEKVKDKIYQTKKQNGTLIINKSKEEEQVYQLLLTKFDKNNIVRQYKSVSYPFKADFYIKSLDLYIEYQGSHYHGSAPFNENNPTHQKILQKLLIKNPKRDEQAWHIIRVWTYRDPLKRKVAKQNNLNWKEFWSIKEVEEFLKSL